MGRSENSELFQLTHGGFSEVPDAASLASGSTQWDSRVRVFADMNIYCGRKRGL